MKTIHTLLLTSFAIAISAAAANAAATDVSGSWKLAIGASTVCTLTLSPDGTASYTGACTAGDRVARYNVAANRIELRSASGETVGILYANGESYTGKRFSDGRTLILSR